MFFRSSMKDLADELGVDGWVRNLPDGSVEAFISGEEEKVRKLIEWCHRGPPLARVTRVVVEKEVNPSREKGFRIIY